MGGSSKNKSNNRSKVSVFWMPGRKSRKHKHENHHRHDHNPRPRSRQNSLSDMMSGDSTNPHHGSELKYDHSLCTATSSTAARQDKSVQSEATVLVEQSKPESPTKELPSIVVSEPANRDSGDQTADAGAALAADVAKPTLDAKQNGNMDKLDGVWAPSDEKRRVDDEPPEKEECAVKCLYYSIQCCECTIL